MLADGRGGRAAGEMGKQDPPLPLAKLWQGVGELRKGGVSRQRNNHTNLATIPHLIDFTWGESLGGLSSPCHLCAGAAITERIYDI